MATRKTFCRSFLFARRNELRAYCTWAAVNFWDTYLAPFQAAIRDGKLAAMMNAYPQLDGEVVAASRRILTELLRDKRLRGIGSFGL